jgi:hypothetical protein
VDVQEMISKMQDAATVRRVYGEPYEKDSATIIPTARISARGGSGAAGGGEHTGPWEVSGWMPNRWVPTSHEMERWSGSPSSTSAARHPPWSGGGDGCVAGPLGGGQDASGALI